MAKTKRMIMENISLVDIVIELLDARAPLSSKNPDIDTLAQNKKRIVVLNKADMADPEVTKSWVKYFEAGGKKVILADSLKGNGLNDIITESNNLMKEKIERLKQRGRIFVPIRSMIVGIPNVGKSTLINKISGKNIAQTGDRPGVTKSKQWVRLRKGFELLDTPGILWPKFEDHEVGIKLAVTGAIKDEIMDTETLAANLIERLMPVYPDAISGRYKVEVGEGEDSFKILEKIGERRGFKIKGGAVDLNKAAIILLDEFRECKLGKISLERPTL
jgi:ribosome biogenesis GTPase A